MSKIDSKSRNTGKRSGILSSFLATQTGRGGSRDETDQADEAPERDQMPDMDGQLEEYAANDGLFDDGRGEADGDAAAGGKDKVPDGNGDGDVKAGETGTDVAVAGEGGVPAYADDQVYTTSFNDVANARLWRRTKEARKRAKEKPRGFRDVFTPTRPKRKAAEFAGRRALIGSVIEAIEEECAHVVMCGETGLGKTSMSNVIAEFARESGYLVARITGTEDLNFGRFIRTLFEELFQQIDETPAGRVLWESLGIQDMNELLQDNAMDLVSEFLGEESLDVTRVIRALDKLSDNQAIVIIDDYDQIKSREVKTRLVQVMKALSDQGGWLSFYILGRAESPSELLQDDIDNLPNAEGLYLDPLSLTEIEDVIQEGGQKIGAAFNQDTVQAIARLSQGVPNVVQWLSFLSVRRATRRKSEQVEIEDLANIVSDAVTKIDARLRNQYDQACRYEKGNSNADLLYLAVRAPCTPSGLFSAATMHVLSRQIIGRKWKESEIHTALLPLCGKTEKSILRKLETSEGTFYRFAHPAMRAVVMLKKIVRIPLLSDMRTRDVDAAYLPGPDETAATNAAAALSHATHAPAQGVAETPEDAVIAEGDGAIAGVYDAAEHGEDGAGETGMADAGALEDGSAAGPAAVWDLGGEEEEAGTEEAFAEESDTDEESAEAPAEAEPTDDAAAAPAVDVAGSQDDDADADVEAVSEEVSGKKAPGKKTKSKKTKSKDPEGKKAADEDEKDEEALANDEALEASEEEAEVASEAGDDAADTVLAEEAKDGGSLEQPGPAASDAHDDPDRAETDHTGETEPTDRETDWDPADEIDLQETAANDDEDDARAEADSENLGKAHLPAGDAANDDEADRDDADEVSETAETSGESETGDGADDAEDGDTPERGRADDTDDDTDEAVDIEKVAARAVSAADGEDDDDLEDEAEWYDWDPDAAISPRRGKSGAGHGVDLHAEDRDGEEQRADATDQDDDLIDDENETSRRR